ncbi:MAG TPA: hypothetical protein DIU15_01485 [Deltaproteobacteria bacterium]|nr:hypothetical protein [Deltaproteobacteria bacterium]HCP44697.1 hypothetical protein [Deltaproteobacteria bacterium]
MIRRLLLVALLAFSSATLLPAAAQALTLDDVKEMASVGVPDNIIVATVNNSEAVFNLTAQQIIELKSLGISDAVIEALQGTSGNVTRTAPPPRDDEQPRRRDQELEEDRPQERRRQLDDDRMRDDDEPRRRRQTDEEEDSILRRRRGGDVDDRDDDRRRRDDVSTSRVQRTPKEIKSAIANYKEKKYLTASLKLYRLLESQKYPEHEAKINYYLGASLNKNGLLHSAQYYFQKVVKEGPSSGTFFSGALAKMVEISDKTKDPIYLIRTIGKIHPDDYPGKVKDDLYYYQGVRDFEKNDFNRAKRNFAKLGRSSTHFVQARYFLGTIYAQQKRESKAYKVFGDIVNRDFRGDPEEIAAVKQLSIINMARINYAGENYTQAAKIYDYLLRLTKHWPTATYEEAWAHFMAEGKEAQALGNLLTLSSPFFRSVWLPEATILEALTFYRICEYETVEDILNGFRANYEPLQTTIEEMLLPYTEGEKPLEKLYESLYSADSRDFRKLPPALYRRVESDRRFGGPHNRVIQIQKELERIKGQKATWRNSEVGKALVELLKQQKRIYMRIAGRNLGVELGKVRDQLGELMGQEALIRFEVVSGEYRKYESRFRNPEAADVQEGIEFDYATNPEVAYWPFNDEFWEDELGYYVRDAKGDCKE